MSIKENIERLKSLLPGQVTLVAVSKTKPVDMLMEAYEAGQRDFGENYVQELSEKHAQLPGDIRWHFIGHLQSNKVKYIAPFVYLIHGVDSLKLLQEINKQAQKLNRQINCLLQVYIAREESKFGLDFEEAEAILDSPALALLQNIKIVGVMGMATNTADERVTTTEFTSLKTFADQMKRKYGERDNLAIETISMGMSSDYKLAVLCGSTMVRIGSSIFGERNYKINS